MEQNHTNLLRTRIGRFRVIAFLEGMSLLILLFIAMPLKYYYDSPGMTKIVGALHGALFLLFVFYSVSVGIQHKWKFTTIALVILSSFIPFGTFYVDHKILSKVKSLKA